MADFLKALLGHAPGAAEKTTRGGLAIADLISKNPEIIAGVEKLTEDEEPELFTRILGIPTPFMQLGTYMGIEGWKGLAVDLIADPTNFLGGLGSLTKAARGGGKIARALEGAEKVAEVTKASRLGRGEKAFARAAKEAEIAKGTESLARFPGKSAALSLNQGSKAAEVAKEIAFKGLGPERATRAFGALTRRSAQLDSFGHRRLLDFLSQADNEREAIEILDQLDKYAVRQGVEETVVKGTMKRRRVFERGVEGGQEAIKGFKPREMLDITRHLPGQLEMRGLRNRILTDGLEAGKLELVAKIEKREDLGKMLARFAEAGDATNALKISKEIEKLEPSRAFEVLFKRNRKAWKSYFQQLDKAVTAAGVGAKVTPLARGVEEQIAARQRNLLTFQIPFLPGTEKVIATGAPFLTSVVKTTAKAKALPVIGAITKPARGAYAGAGVQAAARSGALQHQAAYDTVGQLGNTVLEHFRATGLGTPEKVDDIFTQYWASKEAAKDLSAAFGDEIRAAVAGKDDAIRLAMDDPQTAFNVTSRAAARGATSFSKGLMKQGAGFSDMELALMQELERFHVNLNDAQVAEKLLKDPIPGYIPRLTRPLPGKEKEYEEFLRKIKNSNKLSKSHYNKRSIEFLQEAFDAEARGEIAVEHDIGKIYQHMTEEVINRAAKKRLYERLRKFRIEVPTAAGQKIPEETDYVKLATRKGSKLDKKYPKLYVASRNPDIIDIFYPGKKDVGRPSEILLHRKYAPDLEIVFGGQPLTASIGLPREQKIADALMRLNSVGKRSVLGSDAVTYGWLAERATGTLGRQWLDSPVAMTRMGAYHRARATDMWKTAMEAGLKGNPIEQDIDLWSDVLEKTASAMDRWRIPLVGRGLRGWRAFANAVEGPAWKYFHPSSKMTAFSELYSRALYDPRFTKLSQKEIAQGVAAHVNNAFSGLNWERMWVGAAGQKWLRLLMIAPDWTFSTIRLGADLFANQVARVPFLGRDMVAPAVRAAYARDYALRAGILTFGFMELANLATSSDFGHFLKTGHLNGHHMSDNEEGHRAQLQLPIEEDGKKLFWVPQKQWQDFSDLANVFDSNMDPYRFFGNRMGLIPNAFNTMILGRDSFGYPIVSTKDGFLEKTARRLAWILERNILPSWTQTILGIGSAKARPIRGALEFAASIRTGKVESLPAEEEVEEPTEVIDLRKEPAPPPDPIPPEFEAAMQEELKTNPSYMAALNEHLARMRRQNQKGRSGMTLMGMR